MRFHCDVNSSSAQRPALPAAGENQPTKRNQSPRLNPAQNAEPTSRPVHALLGCRAAHETIPLERPQSSSRD